MLIDHVLSRGLSPVFIARAQAAASRGTGAAKVVEEVFVRTGRVLNLHLGGRIIRTTAEHPFYVLGRGWVPAGELRIGDPIPGTDPAITMAVEGVADKANPAA